MKEKRFILYVLLISAAGLLLSAAVTFIVDPLQHYRKASFYQPVFKNQRYINPGLARHYHYDTIILGASMTDNISTTEVDRLFRCKALKLSVDAATPYEIKLTFDSAVKTGKLRRAIIACDSINYGGPVDRLFYGPGSIPFYLYDDDPWNDYKYLLNFDVVVNDIGAILRYNIIQRGTRFTDISRAYTWGDEYVYSKSQMMLNWGGSLDVRRTKQKIDKISHQFVDNFEKNVYMPIASHPDIEFIIFFPPYSIARWLDIYRSGSLMQIINFNKYLITRLDTLKNCRSYYFQDLEEITHNLDNYRDQDHHHPKINSWIINQIAQGNCQVNGNTIDSYSNNLLKQVDLFIKDKE